MRRTPLLATTLLVLLPLTGCSGGDSTAGQPGDEASTSAPSHGDGNGEEPAEEPAVTVGEHPYVWPCRLLTPDDATELLPLTDEADFAERGRALSVGEDEMAQMKGTVSGQRISSSCTYAFGDQAGTQATLSVDQYRTERQAATEWRTVKMFGDGKLPPGVDAGSPFSEFVQAMRDIIEQGQESVGGVRLPGIDDRVLWRVGTNSFIATTGSVVLTFSRKRDSGITDDLTQRDAELAERVLTEALDRVGDPDLGTPTDPWFVQDDDWPTFLAPCSLLDAEAVELLFPGVPLEEVSLRSVDAVPDVNLTSDSQAGRSHDSSCERSDVDGDHTASLRLQYVAPQDEPEEVLDSYLSNLVFGDPDPGLGRVRAIRAGLQAGGLYDVDASYVLVTQQGDAHYYALLDRYVIELEAGQVVERRGRDRLPESESLDSYTLKTAMEAVVAKARSRLGTEE
ncbi:hypothetical protein [Nocardioides terrigena]|uniref:hypothetical protein n=1 Tax=Nocardioides terrigena TaxID=424797 RepID=UPI000D318EC2|nr:hypothetical protein [Nocardioides terrigena]